MSNDADPAPSNSDPSSPSDPSSSDPSSSSTTPSEPAGAMPGPPPGPGRRPERLHRLREGRMIAGVCEGLADYFDVDTTLVRVAFVALALLGGFALPLYLAGWLLIPEEGTDRSVAEDVLGRHVRL